MFDIGWSELLVILVVALIVVGPKDLPRIVRTFGQWSGKARAYARDFQRTIEEAAEETEMASIRKEIEMANRELADIQRSPVNLDTVVKLEDGESDPPVKQFGNGDGRAKVSDVTDAQSPATPAPASPPTATAASDSPARPVS